MRNGHEDQGSNVGNDGDTIESLRAELNEAEVLIIALKARKLGAENRIAYLENLIRECWGKSGIAS